MFEIQNYASFIAAILLFQLAPGPGTLAILNATGRGGIGAGMGAVLGTLSGDFVYMAAAVLGLAAVLEAYPSVLSAMQWAGVSYLCWMGWKLLRAPAGDLSVENSKPPGGWIYFRQAFAVSLTNPKVVMFFMAFFPLFLAPGSTPATLVTMMVHVTGISLAYQAGLVLIGNTVARKLSRVKHARLMARWLAGAALIGFGIKLALNNK
jgi:threonine/homoserine/homoserine lactone efflux protein